MCVEQLPPPSGSESLTVPPVGSSPRHSKGESSASLGSDGQLHRVRAAAIFFGWFQEGGGGGTLG